MPGFIINSRFSTPMHMNQIEGRLYLEHEGQRFLLDTSDISILRRMTPLGRKVHFRNRAKSILAMQPEDPQALFLLEWFSLPARVWSFRVPEKFGPADSQAI